MIEDYEPINHGFSNERLKTTKIGKCDGKHCSALDTLGPFDLLHSTWKTGNIDRASKTECSDLCACDKDACMNRQITKHDEKVLGTEVIERPT